MSEPYHQLHVHLVWATWGRCPLIIPEIEEALYACIQAECRALKADPICIGGIEDHIHLLVKIPTTVSIAQLVKQVKGASSHLATHRLNPADGFKWQAAYGAFSVSLSHIPRIKAYILQQKTHHSTKTLIDQLEKTEELWNKDA